MPPKNLSNTAIVITTARTYRNWIKPKRFDNTIIVICGSAGLITAYIAADAVATKVTLVDKHRMSGDCLNTGCIPSKALISTTRASDYGINKLTADFEFADVMAHVQMVIKTVEPHDSVARYQSLIVDVIEGNARIVSTWEVELSS